MLSMVTVSMIHKHFAVAYINIHDVYRSLQRNG